MKLFYCGNPGQNYGWGVCNTNLIKHLGKLCDLEVVDKKPTAKLDGAAFVPIVDYKMTPIFEGIKSQFTMGYCFTEAPLDDDSRRNAHQYDLIFAGSTWNKQRITDADIRVPCKVLIQGIDHELFKPQPPSERNKFVVFSGGKFEFRKGQDYVIAAMKQFMRVRQDAVLLTAWHNHWQSGKESMRWSWLVDHKNPLEGLPMDRVISCPLISHEKCPEIYAQSHVGLFPNRCEAGTNLVMCEYMACDRPVIATYATGHKDVLDYDCNCFEFFGSKKPDPQCPNCGGNSFPSELLLTNGDYDPAGWFNPHVADIIAALEWAYTNREQLPGLGEACARMAKGLSWEKCAKQILAAIPK